MVVSLLKSREARESMGKPNLKLITFNFYGNSNDHFLASLVTHFHRRLIVLMISCIKTRTARSWGGQNISVAPSTSKNEGVYPSVHPMIRAAANEYSFLLEYTRSITLTSTRVVKNYSSSLLLAAALPTIDDHDWWPLTCKNESDDPTEAAAQPGDEACQDDVTDIRLDRRTWRHHHRRRCRAHRELMRGLRRRRVVSGRAGRLLGVVAPRRGLLLLGIRRH